MKRAIEANALYRPLWQTKKRYVISIGGRGGDRSYEASQKIVANLVQTKRLFRAVIMRAVSADIKHSIWRALNDRIEARDIEEAFRIAGTVLSEGSGLEAGDPLGSGQVPFRGAVYNNNCSNNNVNGLQLTTQDSSYSGNICNNNVDP